MKKNTLLIFFLFILSCSQKKNDTNILTSFYPIQIFTLNIIKDTPLKSELLFDMNTGCPHDYSLNTKDMRKIENTSVFIMNGLIEPLDDALIKEINKNAFILKSADGLFSVTNDFEVNEHTWLSPKNAIEQSRKIKDALSQIYPKYKNTFEKNFIEYEARLENLLYDFKNTLVKKKDAVTIHGSFTYLFNEIGINIIYDMNESMSALNPKSVMKIKEYIKNKNDVVIVTESEYEDIAKIISEEISAPYYTLDIVSSGDSIDETIYENVMRKNMSVLKEAFDN